MNGYAEGAQGVDLLGFSVSTESHRRRIQAEGGRFREIEVPTATMSRLLERCAPPSVDFISIDVEGAELEVLRGLDLERWRPRVVLVEDNSGGKDLQVKTFMNEGGYKCIHHLGSNDVYVPHAEKDHVTEEHS